MDIKRISDKWTDLGQILKDNPMQIHVYRTTMRPVASHAGGFNYHSIKTPAPAYLYHIGFNPNFGTKKQDMLDNIAMIKAKLEYEKLHQAQAVKQPGQKYTADQYNPPRVAESLDPNINA